ncbi:UNVERIFIED_CONTAM: hypothetical protein FKN15_044979, partial [Acipenser sinensis]
HLQEGRKAQQYLDHCWKQMDNSKKKFERECRETEKAQLGYEKIDNDPNATKADVEKAKAQLHLRTHMADESKNEYAAQLQNFNGEQQKHFYSAIPIIFKSAPCSPTHSSQSFTVSDMQSPKFSSDPIAYCLCEIKTVKPRIPSFRDLKRGGPAVEDFSHLPPEQRRKKLQQRIDELNRELQKEVDQSPEGSYNEDAPQENRGPPQPDPHEFDDEFDDDDPLPAVGHCKALYSFDGQNEGTLAMVEGEVMYIIEEDKGDGWTRARKQNGEEGYVPTSYVDITLEKNSKGAVTYI